ncbi:MAG TPA: C-GCAxxG-C-C family (seleno)protein [Clostridia bacterium]|nr:C-GCAxxG-C-C family (seleno)protein [Clostridia bacterium]
MPLYDYLAEGNLDGMDLNCAETILYGANAAYSMGLTKDVLRLSAGFGGGMSVEDTCGIVTGGVMVLSELFVKDHGHEGPRIKELTAEWFKRMNEVFSSTNCASLKAKYRTPERGCGDLILNAAKILDEIVERESARD